MCACSCMCLCENRLAGSCMYTEMCVGKTGVSLPHFLIGESLKRNDRACLHLDLDV